MNLRNKINGVKEIWQFDNRWHLLLSRLFFSKEKINIYNYKKLEILVDHSAGDSNGVREVLTSNMYRRFIDEMNLNANINVLDLGSNNGGFPLLLKAENIEIKKLVCIEFNPKTFSRMRFNIERNFDCEFIPLNVAVCGEKKTIDIAFGDSSTSDNIYQSSNKKDSNSVQIRGITFDEIYRGNFKDEIVDICKIDIEGAEFEVLQKKESDLIKNCRYLLIEIHHEPDRPRELILNRLNELEFFEMNPEKRENNRHYVHFFVNRRLN